MIKTRYRRIIFFFTRTIISLLFWDVFLPRIGFRRLSARSRSERLWRIANRYRKLAIKMGGVLIKVGQFLSSRMDMMPPEITDELSNLQDKVPAEDFNDIRRLAEAELGQPLSENPPDPWSLQEGISHLYRRISGMRGIQPPPGIG